MSPRITTAIYLALICIQFAVIIGLVLSSREQESWISKLEKRNNLMKVEATDWEQIANSYKRAATTYALSSEKCLETVRLYQGSVFQPQEIGK
jgi:hypothetical protein